MGLPLLGRYSLCLLLLLAGFSLIQPVFAQTGGGGGGRTPTPRPARTVIGPAGRSGPGVTPNPNRTGQGRNVEFTETIFGDSRGIGDYFSALYIWSISIGIIAATISVMRAGYMYAMSKGNPTAISSAKEIILNVVVGVTLLLLSYTILRFILGQRVQEGSFVDTQHFAITIDTPYNSG